MDFAQLEIVCLSHIVEKIEECQAEHVIGRRMVARKAILS